MLHCFSDPTLCLGSQAWLAWPGLAGLVLDWFALLFSGIPDRIFVSELDEAVYPFVSTACSAEVLCLRVPVPALAPYYSYY